MVFLVCRSRGPEPVDRIPGGELGEDPETGKKGKEADLCRLLYFLVWPL